MASASRHYFQPAPDVPSEPKDVDVLLGDVSLTLSSDSGVFSHGRLDEATRILLETAPPPPSAGAVLDLGCGYGAIALTLAARSPSARVLAIDVNERARALTAANADRNGLPNVEVVPPDELDPDIRFDVVYSNPPIRIGKQELRRLLSSWLGRLVPDGVAYLVVGKHLGADSLAAWLRAQDYTVTRLASRRSYRVLEVRPPAATKPSCEARPAAQAH